MKIKEGYICCEGYICLDEKGTDWELVKRKKEMEKKI